MGQYIRWQAIIAFVGILLLAAYLNSITVVKTTVIVPAEGGVYQEGVVGTLQYLNPLLAEYNPVDQAITRLIFDGLTQEDGQGNLKPALAQNWSVSEDGRVYIFVLYPNLKWSDGTPVTTDDVLFTFNLIQSPEFPGNPAWQAIWETVIIEQVDSQVIRFILAEPFPSFPYYTTIGILPVHLLKEMPARDLLTHSFNLNPIGTGPFKLLTASDKQIVLTRNPRYWGQSGKIEQIRFKFYSDATSLYQAFQRQDIDGMGDIADQLLDKIDITTNLQLYSASLPHHTLVYFNLQQPETLPFFQETPVRQALALLINRQMMIDMTLQGQAIPASSPILPYSWAYNPNQAYPTYNPTQAEALLDEAGWVDTDEDGIRDKEGIALQFSLLVSRNPIQLKVAEYLVQAWEEAGIRVTVETEEAEVVEGATSTSFTTRLTEKSFQAALVEIEYFGDPDPYHLWHQTQIEAGQNIGGWDHTAASIALEEARLTVDQGQRIQYYYTFQEIFAEEQPALVLYYPVYTYGVRNTVKGVEMSTITNPADRFQNITEWYLLTQRIIETSNNSISSGQLEEGG